MLIALQSKGKLRGIAAFFRATKNYDFE